MFEDCYMTRHTLSSYTEVVRDRTIAIEQTEYYFMTSCINNA